MTQSTQGTPAAARRADLRSLARGGSLNLVSAGISALANLLLIVLVTRGFHKSEAGIFFAATSVFLLGETIAKLGTQTGLVYFIARFRMLDALDKIRRCLVVALTPVLVAAGLIALVLFLLAPHIAHLAVRGQPGNFVTYLRVLAIFLPIAALSDTVLASTRGFRTMRPSAFIEDLGRPAAQLALVLLVVVAGHASLLSLAWVGPYLPAALLAWVWLGSLHRGHGVDRTRSDSAGTLTRDFWSYTWPRALASVTQLALQRLDIILVAALRGPAEAAIYTAATRFLVVGQLGSKAISTSVQPQLAEQLALNDRRSANVLYRTATSWLILVTWPLYLLCAVFASYLLLMFGNGYDVGTSVVVVLALAMLVATGCGMVDMVLSMAGRTSWNLVDTVLALSINVGLDLVLIPRYGILGAAVGWAAAIVAKNLIALAQVGIVLRLHPFDAGTLSAASLAGLCFGVLPFASRAILGDGVVTLATTALLGLMAYGYGCWHRRKELRIDALRAIVPGRRLARG